jgi:hypothetical protein
MFRIYSLFQNFGASVQITLDKEEMEGTPIKSVLDDNYEHY